MSSSTRAGREVAVEIAVQPPSIVGVNRRLVPPVVARTSDPQLISDLLNNQKQVWATSMLTSSTGQDFSHALNGSWNVSAQLVTGSGGSGGSRSHQSRSQWLYFIFNPVQIRTQGIYTFSVVVNALSLTDGSAVAVGGRTTRQLTVVNQATPPERPSSSERHVLRLLEENGVYQP